MQGLLDVICRFLRDPRAEEGLLKYMMKHCVRINRRGSWLRLCRLRWGARGRIGCHAPGNVINVCLCLSVLF